MESFQKGLNTLWELFDKTTTHMKSTVTPVSSAQLVVNQYLQMPLINRNEDPWEKYIATFPVLTKLAIKYACFPGTSVPSERVFPKAGQVTNDRHNRLSPKNLDFILFFNSNSYLCE